VYQKYAAESEDWKSARSTTNNTYAVYLNVPDSLGASVNSNIVSVTVVFGFLGDVNGDGKVGGKDIALAAVSFGTVPENARWNPDVGINLDVKIDGEELVLIALRFGMAACSP